MLRKPAQSVVAGITVALGVLTVLFILGPGLIDPLLTSDRIDAVRAAVLGLIVLALGCFVLVAVIDRRAAARPPG